MHEWIEVGSQCYCKINYLHIRCLWLPWTTQHETTYMYITCPLQRDSRAHGRPCEIHTHDFVIYTQFHVVWITFVHRPTCVSTNYLHKKFNFTCTRMCWVWQPWYHLYLIPLVHVIPLTLTKESTEPGQGMCAVHLLMFWL